MTTDYRNDLEQYKKLVEGPTWDAWLINNPGWYQDQVAARYAELVHEERVEEAAAAAEEAAAAAELAAAIQEATDDTHYDYDDLSRDLHVPDLGDADEL